MRPRIYVGQRQNGAREVFRSMRIPTEHSHGKRFSLVVGPFRTVAGAELAVSRPRAFVSADEYDDAVRRGSVNRRNPPPIPRAKGAPYAWIITEDLVNAGKYVKTVGPRRASDKMIAQAIEYGERWRIKDDDGVIYYYGRIFGEYDGFEPLDDFGGPNDGATSIEYQRNHGWEPL